MKTAARGRRGSRVVFATVALLAFVAWLYMQRRHVMYGDDGQALSILRTIVIAVGVLAAYIAAAEVSGVPRALGLVIACIPLAGAYGCSWYWERQKALELEQDGVQTMGIVDEGWLTGRTGAWVRYRARYDVEGRVFHTRSQNAGEHEITRGHQVAVTYSRRDPRIAEIRR